MDIRKSNVVIAIACFLTLLSFLGLMVALQSGDWLRIFLAFGGFAGFSFLLFMVFRHNRGHLLRK
jgi:hypothetical protein